MASPRPLGTVPLEVLQLAERGVRITPLAPNSKKPFLDKWQTDNNTSDPNELAEIARLYPGCNWAMVCGPDSGRFVLDCDRKSGGLDWYQRNLEEHGVEWSDTVRVRTCHQGLHDHFRWPSDFEIGCDNTGKLAPGVDIKGKGGCVAIPPSMVDGNPYSFEDCDGEKDVLPAPSWMLPDLRRIFGPAPAAEKPAEKAGKIHHPHRHERLLAVGKSLARVGACYEAILRQFEIENREFEPWYPHAELERQAKDIAERYRSRVHFSGSGRTNGAVTIPAVGELILVPFSDIQPEPVHFLWEPFIPTGMLTMLTGDPGVGKSFIALSIAAEVTKQGGTVFYMTLENHPRKVLRPRFDVLGGDPTKIFWIKAIQFNDANVPVRTVTLQDVSSLEVKVKAYHPNLIVVDPLQSFLGANIDAYRSNETRPVLDGLAEIAEREDVSPLILRHGAKASTGRIIHRGLGSIDFTGAVRSELYAGETADKKEKAMAHIKSNVGPLGKTLGYKITSADDNGTVYKTGYFAWTGPSDLKPADLTQAEPTEEQSSALEDAKGFLLEYLADGPKERELVIKKSRARSISYATLRRAKKELDIGWELRNGMFFWNLPSTYK